MGSPSTFECVVISPLVSSVRDSSATDIRNPRSEAVPPERDVGRNLQARWLISVGRTRVRSLGWG